jgi:hypothetical protein
MTTFFDKDTMLKICLNVRGTLRIGTGKVVYQKTFDYLNNRRTFGGKPIQIRAHVIPFDPKTPAQISQRSKLAQAVAEWHTATPEQRQQYAYKARSKKISVYMAFIGETMRKINPILGTIWDLGATTWDNGATIWDYFIGTIWDLGATTWDNGSTNWDI